MIRSLCALSLLLGAEAAVAAPVDARQVRYAPPASWVLPPPPPTEGATRPDAPFRFVYTDQQERIGTAGRETYTAYRMRILKPEALQAGNVGITWLPSDGSATVHHLRIIRDGAVLDMLKAQRFQVIQREGGLERSILDGALTATLQAPGLRVGDDIEFAATVVRRDPTMGDHAFGLTQLPGLGMPGAFRYRLDWADADRIAWRATRDLPQAAPTRAGGRTTVAYELRDPPGVIVNDGAPARFNVRRLIEYSDFATWGEVSARFAPLFATAATLAPASPLRAEAAKIAAASADPAERAQAALRFVQDQIRYVYVGLDGGNYRPASADETWERRFGECKAKTAMLLALLGELKIAAEAVLVNPLGDDGSDARLPSPGVFNHVLVRATIGGTRYWLDGTRLGDRHLDMIPPPAFRWALPVRATGATLEAVPPVPLARPSITSIVEIDATAGFDKPAGVQAQHVLRQDEALATQRGLVAMSAEDADRAVRGYWRQQLDWVEPDRVGWRYDERRAALVLSLAGQGKPDWDGDEKEGRSLTIIGAGFFAPDYRRRPKEQDQGAPWANEFPRFKCYATSIRLPAARPGWGWGYSAEHIDRSIGGVRYWRNAGLTAGTMRTVMSSRAEQTEIGIDEARASNEAIPGFNNKMSTVYEVKARRSARLPDGPSPFGAAVDWSADSAACSPPDAKRP